METTPKFIAVLTGFLLAVGVSARAGEKVVLRADNGRFLRPGSGGVLLADRLFPTGGETFELLTGNGNWAALRAADGRFLVVRRSVPSPPPRPAKPLDKLRAKLDKRLGRQRPTPPPGKPVSQLRLVALNTPAKNEPVTKGNPAPLSDPVVSLDTDGAGDELAGLPEQAVLLLVPQEGNATGVKAGRKDEFALLYGAPRNADKDDPAKPRPQETFEIYRDGKIPGAIRSTLALVISGLVMKELSEEAYDKVESRLKKKYIELPAPALNDPGRMKKHRVLTYREEYHVKAQLGGEPDIRITHMPRLKGHFDSGSSVLMFAAAATLPIKGHVRYRIPDRISASTGFTTTIELAMVGEVRLGKSKERVSVNPPELLDIRITLHKLHLSNDILNAARAPIEDFINRELQKRNDRIRNKANKILADAVDAKEFRHPLLRFITLP